ncbi:MAG: DNA/RNA non-specific endonuclease [Pyrinomonadaceae bacterium]
MSKHKSSRRRISSARKLSLVTIILLLVIFCIWRPVGPTKVAATSTTIVISQVYGGGGNSGAPWTNDYIELFNRGTSPVDVTGWSVQYASAAGTTWAVTTLSGTILPGHYYLVQEAAGAAMPMPLPTPEATGTIAMSASAAKIALSSSNAALTGGCPTGGTLIDFVGYGSTATCFEGAGFAPGLSNTTADVRGLSGCLETDQNASDFTAASPTPRNGSTAANACGTSGGLSGAGASNPSTVGPGANALLTVTVTPATAPPSTGISVTANLTPIGGVGSQVFFDNGTNGDVTAGDNIFSFTATVAANTTNGLKLMAGLVADAEMRTANTTIPLTVLIPVSADDHLTMGNPSGATADVANFNNYLMPKPEYTIGYNRDRGTANWVSWHLDNSWLGSAPRQDDFRPDPMIPAGWYAVTDTDFSGSGFDRGHHCPSADRTSSIPVNSATFLMTNMMPQSPDNNQGPWANFETYCRTVVAQGNELYILAGGTGIGGTGSNGGVTTTIASGHVTVPAFTWKIVVILPVGNNDAARVTKNTRTIAIIMPNVQGIRSNPWQQYRVSINAVEALTGYDFLSTVPRPIQHLVERQIDMQ